jgi:dihydropyrimidine dehydrogenase (NAD+) subunit PreA
MIDGKGSHGGYCGPAVKPIALNMVAEIARNHETRGLPISGIGGVTTWRDAAEFLALGAGNVQVCTAAMTYGFKIVQEMISGLSQYLDEKHAVARPTWSGRAVPNVVEWQYLNLNYVTKARIDQDALHQVRALLCGLRGHQPPGDLDEAGPGVRGERRRMRGLQPLRQRLPGGELHHHGAA